MIMKQSEKRIVEMNGNMKMVTFAAAMVLLPLAVFSQQTNKWSNTTANTPDTAYDWMDGANWNTKLPPGEGCYLEIKPSARTFIKSSSIAVQHFAASGNAIFLGDVVVKSANVGGAAIRGTLYSAGWHFGDVIFPVDTVSPYATGVNFCGKIRQEGTRALTVPSGSLNFRFDRYARSSAEERTDDLDGLTNMYIGNGAASFYMPSGADAVSGIWHLTEGSPYACRVSADSHPLAVGTVVSSGEALAEGTFLKHVFDDALIELSAPAAATGDFTLSFDEFKPKFKATFPSSVEVIGGDSVTLCAYRSSLSDDVRISFENGLKFGYNLGKVMLGGDSSVLLPAEMLLGPLTGNCSERGIFLRNAHLAFVDGSSFDAEHPVKMPAGNNGPYTARMTVAEKQAVSIASLSDFAGTIIKEGDGELTVGMVGIAGKGGFSVEGGTLRIVDGNASDGKAVEFGYISLADGTTLVVPACGLVVDTLRVSGSASILGGKVTVKSAAGSKGCSFEGLELGDGASINLGMSHGSGSIVVDPDVGAVVGHPAFWLDASMPETIQYTTDADGVNHVTRWNDRRAGETMFCTNLVLKPTFVNGDKMSEKYVRIANCRGVSDYKDTQILVWNVPIRDIRAVFLVQDPTEGGGCLLGRCSWRVPNSMSDCSDGGPYYRGSYLSYSNPVVDQYYTTPAVVNGRFFFNGRECQGTSTGYLGKFMQLVEHHVNAELAAGSANGIVADAFGGCYVNQRSFVGQSNGGMRIAEYIIYTNSLTHAERSGVAQYLSRKWLGRNIYWSVGDETKHMDVSSLAIPGVSMTVPEGESGTVSKTGGAGIVKEGKGELYVGGYDGSSIDVREGEIILPAFGRKYLVPADSWLHVDAAAEDTLELGDDDVTLARWSGVSGLDGALVNHGEYFKAKVERDAVNGSSLIDLGPMGTLNYPAKAAALKYEGNDALRMARTGFAVYDSTTGGAAVFGSVDSSYPSRGLPHDRSSGNIICDKKHASGTWCGIPAMSNAVANGTAIFRLNGEVIDPFRTQFKFGLERFSFRYPEGREVSHFGSYGQSSEFSGGVKIGEVILFDRPLTDMEMASTEAYLAKKWFGIDTPEYLFSAGDLSVSAGAKLTVLGEGFSATSLSGGGTIDGDVKLAEGGTLTAKITEAGTLESLTVQGTLALGGGSLVVEGDERNLPVGEYEIVSANKIVKGEGEWALPESKRRRYSLQFASDKIVLMVRKPGFYLICR